MMYALRLSPRPCPYLDASERDHIMGSFGGSKIEVASSIAVDQPRAVEENLPSYYEHLSLSLLAPETPEEAPSPRRRRRLQAVALPLPDHMDNIGDFLDGVVAYVEVRSDLGDHSGALATLLYRMGASIVLSLSSSATHAVLCSARSATVRKAKSMRMHIVAARWVMACKDQLRRVEEEDWPMLADAEDHKGLRQYRYKVSGVNDTPSPMSVRNLALLSRARRLQSRKDGDSPLSSPGSPRQVWQSPRKSLRRVLFTRPEQLLRHPASCTSGSEGLEEEHDVSMLSIPETQEVTEVAETQDPRAVSFYTVPETDPAMFDRDPSCEDETFEIPETQPNDAHRLDLPDLDCADSDLCESVSSGHHSPLLPSHQARHGNISSLTMGGGLNTEESLDLEGSFNSLSVHDRTTAHEATEQLEVSDESIDMMIDKGVQNETDGDSENQWFAPSQETNMELTRVVQVLPRRSASRMIRPNVTMVLTQPAATDFPLREFETFSPEVVDSLAAGEDRAGASPSLELVLPQGTSQSLSSTTSPTEENTAVFLGAGSGSIAPSESFRRSGQGVQDAPHLCSEEIAMSSPSEEYKKSTASRRSSRGLQNPDSASMSFPLSECPEKRDSCASLPERRKTVELAPAQGLTSSSKRISDAVTPIPDRLQARISGVFSDDNSPCMDTRRTIVLTGFKNKRSVVKGLADLSRTQDQYDIANEVTTRTEVVVLEEYKRTLAVLLGISWGCWFVSAEWATESIKAGRWLQFKDFEVRDYLPPMVKNRKARLGQIDESDVKIFRDTKVFVTRRGSLKPSADALQRMVLQAGGKVVFDSRQAHVCVGLSKPAKKPNCQYVAPSWIVESVAAGQAQPVDAHRL